MIKLTKKGENLEFSIGLIFIFIAVVLRFLPHPPNFAPIEAMALFGGTYFSRRTALILPIAAMLISDIFIGFYQIPIMVFVYGSFLISVLLGFLIKKYKKWYTIGGSAILSAVLFFLITNFAVWAFSPWYAKTLSGIIQCYIMGLPFFRNTLLGDLFYAAVFFGAYELIEVWIRKSFGLKKKGLVPA